MCSSTEQCSEMQFVLGHAATAFTKARNRGASYATPGGGGERDGIRESKIAMPLPGTGKVKAAATPRLGIRRMGSGKASEMGARNDLDFSLEGVATEALRESIHNFATGILDEEVAWR